MNAHKIFLEACDVFFRHYHNKPYTLFNPALFHRKVLLRQIPQYLQFAFIATAVRFSSQLQWKQRKQATIDSYAQASWEMIISSPDGLGDSSSDVSVIQALALLAIIDAIAGRRRAAWVKIGMAVRISQDLQMMLESDEEALPVAEREERRSIFWSLFLLDRFVCCSFRRPPAINVADCWLYLPVDRTVQVQGSESPLTLGELLDGKMHGRLVADRGIGLLGLSVGFAALLGRTIDCMMNREPKGVEPWRPHSDYSVIYTSLEHLKQLADKPAPNESPETEEENSEFPHSDRTSHLVLCLTLYHLTHCILSHPFLLGSKRQAYQSTPTVWIEAQIASCWGHAQALTTVVVDAKAAGYMLAPSFYSYCILVAGTVHAILLHGEDKAACERALKYLKTSFEYLSEISEMWQNSYIMSDALRFFTNRCVRYSSILLGPASRFQDLTPTDKTVLQSVLDYWAMMDPHNPVSKLGSLNIDCFADTIMGKEDDTTTGSSEPSKDANPTVDPGMLVISSPGREGEFTQWDWDNELGSIWDSPAPS
ncbi:fungal-specific transcription factor domain-containing protein [Aspergillus cavernicola]|uniref:Fungal-specific transcription factor domain-containing protein n=1 Tax=Aspergillus cavernicola TaxID=176166 RepID=A0ABR4I711_9EURO